MEHEGMAFEPGDTMIEFLRVVAENAFRRGFVVGFCAGGVYETRASQRSNILRLHAIASRQVPSLDIKWVAEEAKDGEAIMMLAVDENEDGNLPLIGVSQRSYDALNHIEITPEEEGEDG